MEINKKINQITALVLAKAVKKIYPNVLEADYEITEEGFFYNFDFQTSVSINELKAIQKQMQRIIDGAQVISYKEVFKKEALVLFNNNIYKKQLIEKNLSDDKIGLINIGEDFIDICPKLDIKNTNIIKAIQLDNLAGSYWMGNNENKQLTRINGVAFESKLELEEYDKIVKDRRERDHRKIGNDLELFTFDLLSGQGLPIWLPKGTVIKQQIERFLNDLLISYDYKFVQTPVLGTMDLYIKSQHWAHYRENMFPLIELENEKLVLRPMTCPHHLLVYNFRPRSYRELPFRIAENALLHRYETSGGLTGFERVRSMQLVDTHIVCAPEHIADEMRRSYEIIKKAHAAFGVEIHEVHLSLHDPKDLQKFHNDPVMWKKAEDELKSLLKNMGIAYKEMIGEAAFYGPKIDLQVKTALGRIVTMSTIQLDFLLPSRFEITYKDSKGDAKTPIMIHCGVIGTYERYLSILLEQTKGVLPFWVAPVQTCIIPVDASVHGEYAKEIYDKFKENKIRTIIDDSEERLGKKIRVSQMQKIPYQIIVGDDELKLKDSLTYREYGKMESHTIKIDDFIKILNKKISNKIIDGELVG